MTFSAKARAFSNIAFIKYWGNRDENLRIPVNGSISMNLQGLETLTTVTFDSNLKKDSLSLNGRKMVGAPLTRVTTHLDHIRKLAGSATPARVTSRNSFPTGTGIASSASAFAALTLAATTALGLEVSERELSALARLGSGSASRSIPGGFVEWYPGSDHDSSIAETIASPDHWDLVDLVAIVSEEHKPVGSTGGHAVAPTSPLQAARVADTPQRLTHCRDAILSRDFEQFAAVVEQDTLLMHAVMMTSHPSLIYWNPPTLQIIQAVRRWRDEGLPVCFTIDAGPNVHVITTSSHQATVLQQLQDQPDVLQVLVASAGGPAEVLERPDL